MPHYLNPKSDLVFKRIFSHPKLLKSFLNAVLPLPPDRLIEDLEYLPTENVPEIPQFKYSIVDVRCRDTQGRHFVVEMQLQWSKHFVQRMLFNAASIYVRQLDQGIHYKHLSPIYGLAIVDAVFTDEPNWFHHYRMTHGRDHTKTLDDIQLVFLELPKFEPTTLIDKKMTVLWLRFLTEINQETYHIDKELLENLEIRQALELTKIAAYTPEELNYYKRDWDSIRAYNTLMEDKFDDGFEKGAEEEKEKSQKKLAKAQKELAEERVNSQKKLNEEREKFAKTLLIKGLDVDFVSESTGLNLNVVKQIKNSL